MRYLNGARISKCLIKRKAKICQINSIFSFTKLQALEKTEIAEKEFEEVKISARTLRTEFLRFRSKDKQASYEQKRYAKRIMEKEKSGLNGRKLAKFLEKASWEVF